MVFLRCAGTKFVGSNDQTIRLRGFGFGNDVWTRDEISHMHHSEVDFERLRTMGMNAVRFYLNYAFFEDDAEPFVYKNSAWEWLDQNITWAKKYGIYLILNLHVPYGGFQAQGEGDMLWQDTHSQERLIALWKAIATRYAYEPHIAGYGLLNEPVPTESITQWQNLAQEIINTIRMVDTNHIVFVERATFIKAQSKVDSRYNFPVLEDDNIAYEFHMFEPYKYTHQLLSWSNFGDQGKYPDESISHYISERDGFDNTGEPVFKRNKDYLRTIVERYVRLSEDLQIPLYVGEFGTCRFTFEDGKGGLQWTTDMLDLLNEYGLSYTAHAYHEDDYGIYRGGDQLPDPANTNADLIELFKRKVLNS